MTPPPSTEGLIERLRLAHDWVEERGQRYHAQSIALAADALARTPPTPESPPDDVLVTALKQASWDLRFAKRELGREGNKVAAGMMEAAHKAADEALARFTQPNGGTDDDKAR